MNISLNYRQDWDHLNTVYVWNIELLHETDKKLRLVKVTCVKHMHVTNARKLFDFPAIKSSPHPGIFYIIRGLVFRWGGSTDKDKITSKVSKSWMPFIRSVTITQW